MKKTIIAAMLAIATFVSFSAQAQTADGNTVKTEQCQKKECKKDKKECKKGDKKECKKGDKKGCKKGKKCGKDFKGKKGGHKTLSHKGRKPEMALFNGIELTDAQRSQLKDARVQAKEQEKLIMDSKVQEILSPEQYAVLQQNQQQMKAKQEQRKADMKARRAEHKARKAEKSAN